MRPAPDPGRPPRKLRLLRCSLCHRVQPSSATETLHFVRSGWPRCCGEVMALVNEDERLGDETATDHRSLPP
jgi:hypothetical protein